MYDLIIVGAGMMGSAAAFHASQIQGKTLCLIGPPEPKIRKGQEVFGCWYDEGRLCHGFGSHTWSTLAVKSIGRFRQLEELSGVSFYTNPGLISITQSYEDFCQKLKISGVEGVCTEDITKTWKEHFQFLNLPDDAYVVWEKNISGYISPRNFVKAHQIVAVKNGVKIIPEVVSTISPASSSSYRWDVMTESGSILQSKSVLVAAGGFAGFKSLFNHVAPHSLPDLELRTQTVSYLRVSAEEAERLKSMPPMLTRCSFDNLDGAYILPPILYPDGKWYLKLGHGRAYECKKQTLPEVVEWYVQQTGIPECVQKLAQFLCHMIPGLRVEEVSGDGCLTSHTPDAQPYIDIVNEGFAVALGGNGYGAKASDEIGRLAARLILLGEWDSDIPRDQVGIKWKQASKL